MSDLKSKMPDINEITSMAGKLFRDVKKSITEIIADYKTNHPVTEVKEETEQAASPESKIETPVKEESEEQTKSEPENPDKT